MKILKLFLAGIAAITLTSSCEALGEAFSNSLSFVFTGATVYDGQTALLGVTYKNDVAWEIDAESGKIVSIINKDDDGKNCVAKFNLPAGTTTAKTVKVTCADKNDTSVEKYTGEITVVPWRLQILKKSGESWEDLTETSNCTYGAATGQMTLNLKNTGVGTYKIKMMALQDGKWASFAPIFSLNVLKSPGHKVYWEANTDGLKDLTTATDKISEEVYEKEVVFNTLPTANQAVSVYLGVERDYNNNNAKNPKSADTKAVKRIAQFNVK